MVRAVPPRPGRAQDGDAGMLRGTLVKVNEKCNLEHVIGLTGFAMARNKKSGYIKVYHYYHSIIIYLCFKEDHLDIIEPPPEI